MIRKVFIIFCLASIVIFYACNEAEEKKHKAFLVLFDISGSVKKEEMLKVYADNFRNKIINKIDEGDVLVAGLISDKSIAELTLPVNLRFDEFVPTIDNDFYKKQEHKLFTEGQVKIKDSICTVIDTLLYCGKKTGHTDIFSSLQLAEKVFKNYMDHDKVLVMMSDMIESTPAYKFENEQLTEKRTKEIIDTKVQKGEVPDLNGVKVYVAGANSVNSEKFNSVQNFWLEYFKACHADCEASHYNSALISFDE